MSFTNAQLAQQIADLITYWSSFNEEYSDWLGGTVDGGPGSDGKYPLTNWAGAESLVDSPAKLADNVSGYVGLASASEAAAAASAAAAATSESNASTSASTATAQAALADADRVAAELAESNAASSQTVATTQANLATDRAGYAQEWAITVEDTLVSVAAGGNGTTDYSALHHAAKASADAASASSDAAAAAASAAAAATFDPALFMKLDGTQAMTGTLSGVAASFSGAVTGSNLNVANWDTAYGWGDHAGLYSLVAHNHAGVYEPADATIVKDADFASNGILKRTAAGVYGIVTDNSANWDTAYGWGDHGAVQYQQYGLAPASQPDNYVYINRNSTNPALYVMKDSVTAGPAIKAGIGTMNSTTFTEWVEIGGNGEHILISAGNPKLRWYENDQALDEKGWDIVAAASQLRFRLLNDANTASDDWMTVDRTGYGTPIITFGGNVNSVGTIEGRGAASGLVNSFNAISNGPSVYWSESDQAVDNKGWKMWGSGGAFKFYTTTDAGVATGNVFEVQRTGTTVDKVLFGTPIQTNSAIETNPGAGFAQLTERALFLDGKSVVEQADTSWLRLNQAGDFTSGIYTPNNLRVDGRTFVSSTIFIENGTTGSIRIGDTGITPNVDIGCRNSSYCHFSTTASSGFYWYDDLVMVGTGDIKKASHGNYLYHQGSYNADQAGGVTFSTSAATGGVSGDIWFQYT